MFSSPFQSCDDQRETSLHAETKRNRPTSVKISNQCRSGRAPLVFYMPEKHLELNEIISKKTNHAEKAKQRQEEKS